MAKTKHRRRNVAAGFVDEDGYFHPIRASYDYSKKRAHENRARKRKPSVRERFPKLFNPSRKGKTNRWIKGKAFKVVRKGGKFTVMVKR